MEQEEWRTVVYNGETFPNYEVSTEGRVRSLNYKQTGQIKMLKQHNNHGYLIVRISKNGKRFQYFVHRVVAYSFPDLIPNDNPTEKIEINHIDENKHNNRVENLEWVTKKQNARHGTCQERKAIPQRKKVLCVETGVIYKSVRQASKETGYAKSSISDCCNGKLTSLHGLHFKFYVEE